MYFRLLSDVVEPNFLRAFLFSSRSMASGIVNVLLILTIGIDIPLALAWDLEERFYAQINSVKKRHRSAPPVNQARLVSYLSLIYVPNVARRTHEFTINIPSL